jgi:ornithine cyclodeaminase
MLQLDEVATRAALPMPALVAALRAMFAAGCEMPVRHHHRVDVQGEEAATLLLMPAWKVGAYLGVKIVNVFPGNAVRNLPAVNAAYILMSGRTGEILATIDGGELTARRTAAASALAATCLARNDASTLAIVGTGRLCANVAEAYLAIRPIRRIFVWGRNGDHAEKAARSVAALGVEATAAHSLEEAVARADIVSCATLSAAPLVLGKWLKPGAHVDLIGAFTPDMRESDDEAVRRASVFVDTRAGAVKEAGDIVLAIRSGALREQDIRADLFELCRGAHKGRARADEITLFKSVGAALEDLAGAVLAYESVAAKAAKARV